MKINKIVLYNFNSYEGLNEFDFTCENNSKNIILMPSYYTMCSRSLCRWLWRLMIH